MNPILLTLLVTAPAPPTVPPRPTPVVISDRNLAELAARGRLANPAAAAAQPAPAIDLAAIRADAEADSERRAAWRRRLTAQLTEIRRLEQALESQRVTAGWLWIRYLRTEKAATRERRVRPQLEAARQRLGELERALAVARTGYDELCEQARRAGATPAWFRGLEADQP